MLLMILWEIISVIVGILISIALVYLGYKLWKKTYNNKYGSLISKVSSIIIIGVNIILIILFFFLLFFYMVSTLVCIFFELVK